MRNRKNRSGSQLRFWRRTEPLLPVDIVLALAVGTRFGVDRPVPFAFFRVAVIGTLAHQHLSEHAVGDRLSCLAPLVTGRRLRTDLQDALRLFDGIDKPFRFVDGVAHRLLEIDVFACVHRGESDRRVPVIRSRDENSVDILLGQQFPIIEIAFDAVLVRIRLLAFFVNVANRGNPAGIVLVTDFLEFARNISAAAAAADDADIDLVVGADDTAGRFGCRTRESRTSQPGESAGDGRGLEKIPAIYGVVRGHGQRNSLV